MAEIIRCARHLAVLFWIQVVLCVNNMPPLVWSPMNPLFNCTDPLVYVMQGDRLPFLCPTADYLTAIASTYMFENMWFVETNKTRYDTCNSEGLADRHLFMTCDFPNPNPAKTPKGKNEKVSFPKQADSKDDFSFTESTTYYFIATSHRLASHINNRTAPNSCSDRGYYPVFNNHPPVPYYPLKLKVYVCSEEEVKTGKCTICDDPMDSSCYYRQCHTKIGSWVTDNKIYRGNVNNTCYKFQTRTHESNLVNGEKWEEKRTVSVDCPLDNCTAHWVITNRVYKGNGECLIVKKRNCTNLQQKVEKFEKTDIIECAPDNCSSAWQKVEEVHKGNGKCLLVWKRNCTNAYNEKQQFEKSETINCAICTATWQRVSESWKEDEKCIRVEKRNCSNFQNQVEERTRIVDCNCTNWEVVTTFKNKNLSDGKCTALKQRTCAKMNQTKIELAGCTDTDAEQSSQRSPVEIEDADYWRKITIIIGIITPFGGLVIGILLYKKFHTCKTGSVASFDGAVSMNNVKGMYGGDNVKIVDDCDGRKRHQNGVNGNMGVENNAYRGSMVDAS